jgi:hypothetical protein
MRTWRGKRADVLVHPGVYLTSRDPRDAGCRIRERAIGITTRGLGGTSKAPRRCGMRFLGERERRESSRRGDVVESFDSPF